MTEKTPPRTGTLQGLPALAQQRLNVLMQTTMAAGVFPAAALAVLHRGEWVCDVGYGWSDPDAGVPLTTDALFDLASITKLFTTTACLSLISAGQAGLDTPLIALLPEFGQVTPRAVNGGQDPHTKQPLPPPANAADQRVDPAQVTLWHLLTHTSGLPPWRDVYQAAGPPPEPPPRADPVPRTERWQRALAALCQYEFVEQPGHTVRYSDVGLMLLGEAVARLHGTPAQVDAAIQARVLNPLGITDVVFNPVRDHGQPLHRCVPTEIDAAWRKRRVQGEVHDENACGVGGVAGHAGLFATARSLALFGQAWLEKPARFGIAPELAASACREHAETEGMRRGLGFALKAHQGAMVGDRLSARTYGHSGFTGTTLWIDPSDGLVVALLTNAVYPGRHKEGIYEFRRAVHTLLAEVLQ